MSAREVIAMTLAATALCACGSSKPTRQQLAQRCGQKAAASLSSSYTGAARKELQRSVAILAESYYLQTGKCSAN